MSDTSVESQIIEGTPSTPKNKLLWVLLATNILALAGAGSALAYVVTREAPVAQIGAASGESGQASAAKGEPAGSTAIVPARVGPLIELDAFVVNLDELEGNRYLKMTLSLELTGEPVREAVQVEKPKIRDALITYLSSLRLGDVRGAAGKRGTKEGIHEIVDEIVPRAVRSVYLSEFVIQ